MFKHAAVILGDHLYIHGGHDGRLWLDDLHFIDIKPLLHKFEARERASEADTQWKRLEPEGYVPRARACHTMIGYNNQLILYGGYDGHVCHDALEVLSLASLQWSTVLPTIDSQMPDRRNAHCMARFGHKLLLFGGHAGQFHLNDLFEFDIPTRRWRKLLPEGGLPPPPSARGQVGVQFRQKFIIYGGLQSRTAGVHEYDVRTNRWAIAPATGGVPAGRQRHTMTVVGDKMILFGGFDGQHWLNDFHVLEQTVGGGVDSSIGAALGALLAGGSYSDCAIQLADGSEIQAHKCILAARSSFFDRTFRYGDDRVVLDHWPPELGRVLVSYIYEGRISRRLSVEEWRTLREMADYVLLAELEEYCATEVLNEGEEARTASTAS